MIFYNLQAKEGQLTLWVLWEEEEQPPLKKTNPPKSISAFTLAYVSFYEKLLQAQWRFNLYFSRSVGNASTAFLRMRYIMLSWTTICLNLVSVLRLQLLEGKVNDKFLHKSFMWCFIFFFYSFKGKYASLYTITSFSTYWHLVSSWILLSCSVV